MLRRRQEDVPFTFIAEADSFRSNVTFARERPTKAQLAWRATLGLLVAGGLSGALFFGLPAMQSLPDEPGSAQLDTQTEGS